MKDRDMQVWGMYQPNIPRWQKFLLKLLSPIFVKILENKLKITAEESKRSLENANKILDVVENLLSDGRKFLLNTPHPTYIDFHFCSMVAIMILPQDYGGRVLKQATLENHVEFPKAFNDEVKKIEERAAGKFVINLYKSFRLTTVHKLGIN
eukprot:TRINITY_DN22123_c0_g1_i1.p1 TRINITY_DN22123_c0_g1~~TRINITY_DN22123_c0_g1_i1.p1  ORF type:complete len:170 (+),score=17.62 TRINITY_DN22123_c0_g1_i1:55-510(+)